jgi:DNA-binding response OmpR family regulator
MAVRRKSTEPRCVVLIDDDVDARQMYAQYLRLKGWTVFTAADGRAGLTKTLELRPDAVVLDLAMPKVDGWTVLKQIRNSSMTAEIPTIVVTAMPDTRDAAIYSGADAYLSKPCPPEVLHLQLTALARIQSTRGDVV